MFGETADKQNAVFCSGDRTIVPVIESVDESVIGCVSSVAVEELSSASSKV